MPLLAPQPILYEPSTRSRREASGIHYTYNIARRQPASPLDARIFDSPRLSACRSQSPVALTLFIHPAIHLYTPSSGAPRCTTPYCILAIFLHTQLAIHTDSHPHTFHARIHRLPVIDTIQSRRTGVRRFHRRVVWRGTLPARRAAFGARTTWPEIYSSSSVR